LAGSFAATIGSTVERTAMEESCRNQEIADLLDIWEWCSSILHVKWQRRRKSRNSCLMGLAYAVTEPNFVSPFKFSKIYKKLPRPLLTRKKVLTFWEVQPVPLLELCLGSFTKNSPLKAGLDRIRLAKQHNPALDKIAKKMRAREKRFGSEWYFQGHHPENEFVALKKELASLSAKIRSFIAGKHASVESLAQEVLAQGPWQFGELPATSFVRKTPETLLNRANRLKLWQVAQEVLSRGLEEEESLEALCAALDRKITPSVRAVIEAQGYSIDQVIDDVLNFDMHKSREEITG
jgi:hypothetical protein